MAICGLEVSAIFERHVLEPLQDRSCISGNHFSSLETGATSMRTYRRVKNRTCPAGYTPKRRMPCCLIPTATVAAATLHHKHQRDIGSSNWTCQKSMQVCKNQAKNRSCTHTHTKQPRAQRLFIKLTFSVNQDPESAMPKNVSRNGKLPPELGKGCYENMICPTQSAPSSRVPHLLASTHDKKSWPEEGQQTSSTRRIAQFYYAEDGRTPLKPRNKLHRNVLRHVTGCTCSSHEPRPSRLRRTPPPSGASAAASGSPGLLRRPQRAAPHLRTGTQSRYSLKLKAKGNINTCRNTREARDKKD